MPGRNSWIVPLFLVTWFLTLTSSRGHAQIVEESTVREPAVRFFAGQNADGSPVCKMGFSFLLLTDPDQSSDTMLIDGSITAVNVEGRPGLMFTLIGETVVYSASIEAYGKTWAPRRYECGQAQNPNKFCGGYIDHDAETLSAPWTFVFAGFKVRFNVHVGFQGKDYRVPIHAESEAETGVYYRCYMRLKTNYWSNSRPNP